MSRKAKKENIPDNLINFNELKEEAELRKQQKLYISNPAFISRKIDDLFAEIERENKLNERLIKEQEKQNKLLEEQNRITEKQNKLLEEVKKLFKKLPVSISENFLKTDNK